MSHWIAHYTVSDGVSTPDIRSALDSVTGDDVSQSSPVEAGVGAGQVQVNGDGTAEVTVPDAGDTPWTKKSERAIHQAVQSVDGVGELVEKEGGRDRHDIGKIDVAGDE